jgi:quercetin dioxygenase-like cupin family protein
MNDHPSRRRLPTPAHWDDDLRREFEANQLNGCVGTTLVSETDRVRVWQVRLEPGERLPIHRHVLSYFWTSLTPGKARAYADDGRILEDLVYTAGQTKHLDYGDGEFMMHGLENTGDAVMLFTTVEFLDSANPPLDVPDSVRLHRAAA